MIEPTTDRNYSIADGTYNIQSKGRGGEGKEGGMEECDIR